MIESKNADRLRPATSTTEVSPSLSSNESSQIIEEFSMHNKDYDTYYCDLFAEDESLNTSDCLDCMSLPHDIAIAYSFNQRDFEAQKRLRHKVHKRSAKNLANQSKSPIPTQSKIKQCDNNIDDLVRFIDGNETISDEQRSKKNKKKKNKRMRKALPNEDINEKSESISTSNNSIVDASQILFEKKQMSTSKIQPQEKQSDEFSISKSPKSLVGNSLSERNDSIQTDIDHSSERFIPPEEEEEVNWITISRKQSRHKTIPTSARSLPAASVHSSNYNKQKNQRATPKTQNNHTMTRAQPKVIQGTVLNSKKQQETTAASSPRAQDLVKGHTSQQQQQQQRRKIEPSSVWTKHDQTQGIPTFYILLI